MVAGDFNVVKSIQEKSGSCKLNSYETDFLDCKSKLCLLTSHLQAVFFFFLLGRIRELGRSLWLENWIVSCLMKFGWRDLGRLQWSFLECGMSDHSAAHLSVGKVQSFGPKPYKFFNFWAEHEMKAFCHGLIKAGK
jgi:hypothetical protein